MATYTVKDWLDVEKGSSIDQATKRYCYTEQEGAIIAFFVGDQILSAKLIIAPIAIQEGNFSVNLLLQDIRIFTDTDLDLVKARKPHIQGAEQESLYSIALTLLLAVCEQIQKIPENDLNVLIDNLVERIRNEKNTRIREIVLLFRTLSKLDTFNPRYISQIISSIFTLADSRHRFMDLPDAVRQDVYTVVDFFFKKYSHILIESLGTSKLVEGIIELATFEKKAPCLLVVFPLISHMSRNWNLGEYFPIKISGLKDDSLRLSVKMSDCLTDCIVSNDFYASYAFPHFITSLDEHWNISATVMHEICTVICICVKKYSKEKLASWSNSLWNSLKLIIWDSQTEDHIQDSLIVIRSIAISLACIEPNCGESPQNDFLTKYVMNASNDCRSHIIDSPQKYLASTGRIIYHLASCCIKSLSMVVTTILPPLLGLWKDITLASEKKMLLSVITLILKASIELLETTPDEDAVGAIKAIASFQERLIETLSNAVVELKRVTQEASVGKEHLLKNASYFVPALESLTLLFRIPTFLTRVEQGMIVQEMNKILVKSSKNEIIHRETLTALQKISIYRPTVFADMILPSLLDELPESVIPDDEGKTANMQPITSILDDLVHISSHPCHRELDIVVPKDANIFWYKNFNCFVDHLFKKMDKLFLLKGQVRFSTAIVAALFKGLKLFDGELDFSHVAKTLSESSILPYESIWIQIIQKSLSIKLQNNLISTAEKRYISVRNLSHKDESLDALFLHLVGNIILLVSRSKLNTPENNIVFKFYDQSFTKENVQDSNQVESLFLYQQIHEAGLINDPLIYLVSVYPLIGVQPIENDDKKLTKTKTRLGINKNAGNLAVGAILRILDTKQSLIPRVRTALLHYTQILVAKFHCSTDELQDGGKLLDFIESLIEKSHEHSPQYVIQLYQVIVYIATASFISYDSNLMRPTFKLLIDALKPESHDSNISTLVAQSFRLIPVESEILNKNNYIQVRALRKGLLLDLTKPLIEQYRRRCQLMPQNPSLHRTAKNNYLIAIIGIIRNIEASLVLSKFDIEELVTLALDGTNVSNDNNAKAEYIKLIRMLISERPKYMEKHLEKIIERMIERTHNTLERPSDANFECRILAVDVLRLVIENFGSDLTLPKRIMLSNELAVAKDDCHACVRQAAAQCMLALFYI
ncbi:putative dna repair transcription protein [Erysiphe neolycopersici]|uniref:MMS19 nucleotide excision repair protein n=1 Tax=Erysiphe neolycopersici TaxID=212602 RepID=A0A420HBM5_9PEZI|nr:putative dna repair transcription protein [Erysiphe neolycopersici]